MLPAAPANMRLEPIPVLDTGSGFAMETLAAHEARAHALLDLATGALPSAALRQLDKVSRRWLAKWENAHLTEIDATAEGDVRFPAIQKAQWQEIDRESRRSENGTPFAFVTYERRAG